MIFFNILALQLLNMNDVLKPDLVSAVTVRMVYFCAYTCSEN